jgi:cytidylate kinase
LRAIRIAIDGPSASGKTTTARAVAERLGYRYIDSGALYRAIALKLVREAVDPADRTTVEAVLRRTAAGYDADGGVCLDGAREPEGLRSPEVAECASRVSVLKPVREWVNARLRAEAAPGGVVMEGRDIGTVVLPDAEVKVFLDAHLAERVRRRREDLRRSGRHESVEKVTLDLSRRDDRDMRRSNAPLVAAADAVVIDGTDLGFDEQVEAVVRLAKASGA